METTPKLSRQEIGIAMLAVLNRRVGVKGNAGAYRFLADALGCREEEARELEEFGFHGVQFVKKMHTDHGWMSRIWFVVPEKERVHA